MACFSGQGSKYKLCSANGKGSLRVYGGGNYPGIEMVLLVCVRVGNGCLSGQYNSNLLNVAGENQMAWDAVCHIVLSKSFLCMDKNVFKLQSEENMSLFLSLAIPNQCASRPR